jgi:hypothetical protein
VLTRLAHSILLPRYVMPAIVGVLLGLACALSFAGRRAVVIVAAFALISTGIREASFWRYPQLAPYQPYFSAESREQLDEMKGFIDSVGHQDLPVVVSDCLLYTQFAHYFDPNWTKRLVYLADREREYRYTNSDSSSVTMSALQPYFPVQVADYSQFTATHAEFLLYVRGLSWYHNAFKEDKFSMQMLAEGEDEVYLVSTR